MMIVPYFVQDFVSYKLNIFNVRNIWRQAKETLFSNLFKTNRLYGLYWGKKQSLTQPQGQY